MAPGLAGARPSLRTLVEAILEALAHGLATVAQAASLIAYVIGCAVARRM